MRNWNLHYTSDEIVDVTAAGSFPYYDFHVPRYENYWAEGLFHHNTGKTYVAARVIGWCVERYGVTSVAVCAPTGKAAARITEALREYGISNVQATTIHSLLEIGRNGHDGQGWGFQRNQDNPLGQRFVFVDEASMLDTSLASSLLRAMAEGTHLLLIGDPYQLPPVGHGAPLRDMMAGGVPTARLTEVRRNAGAIVEACRQIKDGLPFKVPLVLYQREPESNLWHRPAETADRVLGGVSAAIVQYYAGDNWSVHGQIRDCQVIVATNKGPLGRHEVNRHLQNFLNPNGYNVPGNPYRENDKIICLRNGWYRATNDSYGENGEAYVANGEQGRVISVDDRRSVAVFDTERRWIVIPNAKRRPQEDEAEEDSEGENFGLGYAITGHKSQGSEWPLVCVIIDPSPGARMVCSREWLYTAISRASGLCVLVGREGVAQMMVRRPSLEKRRTFLADDIRRKEGQDAQSDQVARR